MDIRFGASFTMLIDPNRTPQSPLGQQTHWALLASVMTDNLIFGPLQAEIIRIVANAIAANPTRPIINSRLAGSEALEAIDSVWHAQFPRRLPNFPNGAARGVFGMALWNHLANRPDQWCFSGIPDPYACGQDATVYWRI